MRSVALRCFGACKKNEARIYLADQILQAVFVGTQKAALLQICSHLLRIFAPRLSDARIFCGIPFDVYAYL